LKSTATVKFPETCPETMRNSVTVTVKRPETCPETCQETCQETVKNSETAAKVQHIMLGVHREVGAWEDYLVQLH
jgi:hypothetical protein